MRTVLVPFETAPFPYEGEVPGAGKPFLDVVSGERRGHTARGVVNWLDSTYSDRRALLHIPTRFDPRRPAVLVLFFHGNGATLERDVRRRQAVPRQVDRSGLNAVTVAPQFAVDARDSSAGRFWQPGALAQFLDEAATRLAELLGDPAARPVFAQAPVILVAYSGGYQPAAFSLALGGAGDRVRGVILFDALYSETDRFADWITQHAATGFFVSAYTRYTQRENGRLQQMLSEKGIPFQTVIPSTLGPGSIAFQLVAPDVEHDDFVTRAWVADPLRALLSSVERDKGRPKVP